MSQPPERRHAVMKDIAKACNVSISTVSLVLSQDSRIPLKTKQRVLAAVKSFGYRPNLLARNLSRQSSMTMACVVPYETFLDSPGFYNDLLCSVYEAVSLGGYRMIFEMMTPQFLRRRFYLRLFRERSIDGMIILYPRKSDLYLRELEPFRNSVVVLGSTFDSNPLYSITPNHKVMGKLACEHLVALGHKKIAFFAFDQDLACIEQRRAGYAEALNNAGLETQGAMLLSAKNVFDLVSPDTIKSLRLQGVTGMVVSTDSLVPMLLRAVFEAGLKVPEDLSIVSADDQLFARSFSPPLSTVSNSCAKMATQAMKRLTVLQDQPDSLSFIFRDQVAGGEGKVEFVESELVLRASARPI